MGARRRPLRRGPGQATWRGTPSIARERVSRAGSARSSAPEDSAEGSVREQQVAHGATLRAVPRWHARLRTERRLLSGEAQLALPALNALPGPGVDTALQSLAALCKAHGHSGGGGRRPRRCVAGVELNDPIPALITTIVGAAVGANLILVVLDVSRDRSALDRSPRPPRCPRLRALEADAQRRLAIAMRDERASRMVRRPLLLRTKTRRLASCRCRLR